MSKGFDKQLEELLVEQSQGDPETLSLLHRIINEAEQIDPQSIFGGLGYMNLIDEIGLKGSRIFGLFKDVCGSDMTNLLCVLRSYQLHILSAESVVHAVATKGSLDIPYLLVFVRDHVSRFGLGIIGDGQ